MSGKLTLADLRKLREEQKAIFAKRDTDDKQIVILVGMGTCGIAAGAKEVLSAFITDLDKAGIKDAIVKQTGCMGLCNVEPTVEIHMPGMPDVVYGNVDKEIVQKIIDKHILKQTLLNNLIQDKPAADILK
jgi:NADP-reducing hydrogenase subunit HndB